MVNFMKSGTGDMRILKTYADVDTQAKQNKDRPDIKLELGI
jgi:hypothetical protein